MCPTFCKGGLNFHRQSPLLSVTRTSQIVPRQNFITIHHKLGQVWTSNDIIFIHVCHIYPYLYFCLQRFNVRCPPYVTSIKTFFTVHERSGIVEVKSVLLKCELYSAAAKTKAEILFQQIKIKKVTFDNETCNVFHS